VGQRPRLRPVKIVHTNGATSTAYFPFPGKRQTFKFLTDYFSEYPKEFTTAMPTLSPWEVFEKSRQQTRAEKAYADRILNDEAGQARKLEEQRNAMALSEAEDQKKEQAKKDNTRALREKNKQRKEEERKEAKEARAKFGEKK